jgi:hypothetical protein
VRKLSGDRDSQKAGRDRTESLNRKLGDQTGPVRDQIFRILQMSGSKQIPEIPKTAPNCAGTVIFFPAAPFIPEG